MFQPLTFEQIEMISENVCMTIDRMMRTKYPWMTEKVRLSIAHEAGFIVEREIRRVDETEPRYREENQKEENWADSTESTGSKTDY